MSTTEGTSRKQRGTAPGCDVFVRSVQIENAGHVLMAWSDADRWSHGECTCPSPGGRWKQTFTVGASALMDEWREHVATALSKGAA